jgi:hypothetical protein
LKFNLTRQRSETSIFRGRGLPEPRLTKRA